jgi:hypothetical protein
MFQANVSQMTMSQQGPWHIIRMNTQFHNSTNQPLIVAYHEGSMVMVDNNGNTYQAAGGNPGELQGMGIDRGNQTDSQFVLAPGQTGNAMFSVARIRGNDSPVGTGFSYNLTIDELQAQNGAQAMVVRQYNLNFPNLAPTNLSAAAMPSAAAASSYVGGKGAVAGSANPQAVSTAAPGTAPTAATLQKAVSARPGAPAGSAPLSTPVNAALKSPVTTNAKPAAVQPISTATKPATVAKKPAATTTTPTTSK